MSDDEQDQAGDASAAARLLGALGRAAGDLAGNEAVGDLGGRARAIVEELARTARARAAEAESRRREAPAAAEPGHEAGRGEARGSAGPVVDAAGLADWTAALAAAAASVDTLAETLDATLERLERIEDAVGDPPAAKAGDLVAGLARCERALDGLVRTVRSVAEARTASSGSAEVPVGRARSVLVVARSSARRAGIVLALEAQGLRVRAASGLAAATAAMADAMADAAVLAVEPAETGFAGTLEDWKEHQDAGNLPPVVVVTAAGADRVLAIGLPVVGDGEGGAALAEALERESRRAAAGRSPGTEENR